MAALAADVELLILDEPTAGLDPLMEAEFRLCIEEDRQNGRTVLLASHILAEVEALCDRISIVRAGRIVESGTLTESAPSHADHDLGRGRKDPVWPDRTCQGCTTWSSTTTITRWISKSTPTRSARSFPSWPAWACEVL